MSASEKILIYNNIKEKSSIIPHPNTITANVWILP